MAGFEGYVDSSWLIPLLPLVGAVIAGLLGSRYLRGQSHWPIWVGVGASALISMGLLINAVHDAHEHPSLWKTTTWFRWIDAGDFHVEAGAWIDPLTVVMLAVVCGIGFLITIFAAGYMKGEAGYFRFFAYLGLFIFAMTCLVMGNNFIMLYLGWEGVGLCSYLLIGYYYEKPAAREAAKKAFLVNRVGDFGFGIGIMLIYLVFGNVSYFGQGAGTFTGALEMVTRAEFLSTLPQWKRDLIPWIPFCLMVGAFGKSAQFPLHVWLPDAMEGPTPVSALIHAATMVTAGVYMIARCGTLFAQSPAALVTVAVVGAFTALFAATIALRQFDLKKVFAYSTVSQLGFMFVGVGVLAPVAGVFHLVTHAFFKALLFLSSGVVMHAMLGHLDMRKMSGLRTQLPKTRWLMLIGCAALAGVPLLSGFFSKDEIVAAAWGRSKLLGLVMLFTALLTAYYTFRLYFRVFEGPTVVPDSPAEGHHGAHDAHDAHTDHATASAAVQSGDVGRSGVDSHLQSAAHQHATSHDHGHHDHEPGLMIVPLIVLAIGAVLSGFMLYKGHALGHFLGKSPSFQQTYVVAMAKDGAHVSPPAFGQPDQRPQEDQDREHYAHLIMMIVSGVIALAGIFLAYQFHLKNRAAGERLPERAVGLTRTLEAKYWIDEAYQAGIVEPLRSTGRVFFAIDRIVVDGLVWAIGFVPQLSGFTLKLTTQRGYLQGYAGAMALGILVILLVVFL